MSVCIYAGMYTHTCTSAWMVCISRIMSPASFLSNISPKPKIDTNCQTQTTDVSGVSHRPGGFLQVQGLPRLCRSGGLAGAFPGYKEDTEPPPG